MLESSVGVLFFGNKEEACCCYMKSALFNVSSQVGLRNEAQQILNIKVEVNIVGTAIDAFEFDSSYPITIKICAKHNDLLFLHHKSLNC